MVFKGISKAGHELSLNCTVCDSFWKLDLFLWVIRVICNASQDFYNCIFLIVFNNYI